MNTEPQGLVIHTGIATLQAKTQPLKNKIISHPLYQNIHSLKDVQNFMNFHIYAVWDFMSLLKSLQRKLTGVTLPWLPTADPMSRRLMNQIVLCEESDLDQNGHPISHFELYLRGMKECGANTQSIEEMMAAIREGQPFKTVMSNMPLPEEVHAFLKNTWDLIDKAPIHEIAAVFAIAREGLIPDMFMAMTSSLKNQFPKELYTFNYYLDRHTEEDEKHAQMAYHMLSALCKDDTQKWEDATQAVQEALQARLSLWDGALRAIQSQ